MPTTRQSDAILITTWYMVPTGTSYRFPGESAIYTRGVSDEMRAGLLLAPVEILVMAEVHS